MTIRTDERPPPEYADFLFCREFHCLPGQMDELDGSLIDMWFGFLNAEAEAGKLKDMQSSLYGR